MSNLMIRNGYNGSHRRYRERVAKETRQEAVYDFKRSLHFPAIIRQDKHAAHRQLKTKSPQNRAVGISPDDDEVGGGYLSYSPTLTRDNTDDCIILFPDEISELQHLALTLGLNSQRRGNDVLDRERYSRWNPVKESKGEQWWKNSKKWIKHTEEDLASGHIHDVHKQNQSVTRTRRVEKVSKESRVYEDETFDGLPENIKRKIRSVVIPGIGCSYRLPVINKKQKK